MGVCIYTKERFGARARPTPKAPLGHPPRTFAPKVVTHCIPRRPRAWWPPERENGRPLSPAYGFARAAGGGGGGGSGQPVHFRPVRSAEQLSCRAIVCFRRGYPARGRPSCDSSGRRIARHSVPGHSTKGKWHFFYAITRGHAILVRRTFHPKRCRRYNFFRGG